MAQSKGSAAMIRDTEDVVADHERIWLQPKCCAGYDGRQWCQDNVFDDGECEDGSKATEYVRADVAQSLSDRIDVLEGLQRRIITQYRNDLSGAHAEICKLQKLDPATHSWPDWTPQANTLRWFDELDRAALHQEGISG